MKQDAFEAWMRTRVVFGRGVVTRCGELARELGGERVLIVTDHGIVAAGHAARVEENLRNASITTATFADVRENPTTEDVDRGMVVAREFRPTTLVALGGASAMDCTKGINFLLSNGGRIQDYWGVGKATRPMLPSLAIPTTSGTGSEAQSFALISDPVTHQKMACGDRKVAFRVAILDPELTCSQPARVTALTGIDALAHALETWVTRPRNRFSAMYSREAWRLLVAAFPRVIRKGEDSDARCDMQLGAHWAGVAIEHSMLGAAHSLANPLTAHFQVPHGQAVGVMLPHVISFNALVCNAQYVEAARIAKEVGGLGEANTATEGMPTTNPEAAALVGTIQQYLAASDLATNLRALSIPRDAIPDLAREAAQQWTAKFNPRELNTKDLEQLYVAAY